MTTTTKLRMRITWRLLAGARQRIYHVVTYQHVSHADGDAFRPAAGHGGRAHSQDARMEAHAWIRRRAVSCRPHSRRVGGRRRRAVPGAASPGAQAADPLKMGNERDQ